MGLKKVIKYYLLGESIKEIEVSRILEKISKSSNLTKREKRFLELYNYRNNSDDKDYMLLSKNVTCEKIKALLDDKKNIICDLHDRDGLIGMPILDINNDFECDECEVILRDMKVSLNDRFLYNIIYNVDKKRYSLQEQDEYHEKLYVRND